MSDETALPSEKTEDGKNEKLEAALEYAEGGLAVFPCHSIRSGVCSCKAGKACHSPGKRPLTSHGLNDAAVDAAQISRWWRQWPDANIGIQTGAGSGIFVVDVDPRHEGDKTLAELLKANGPFPEGVTCATGGDGMHYYFRHPGTDFYVQSKNGALGPGLDVKGDGGYVVGPPSNHISGGLYVWHPGKAPWEALLPEAPKWLLDRVAKPRPKESATATQARDAGATSASATADVIGEGGRNAHLASVGGALRRKGCAFEAIVAALQAENARRCSPPLPGGEVQDIARSIARYEPAGKSYIQADTGNAERFSDRQRDRLIWVPNVGWHEWADTHWVRVDDARVNRLSMETMRLIFVEAEALDAADKKTADLHKFALASLNRGRIEAAASLARGLLRRPSEELDRDPMLFNTMNGTVDLRTGTLRPHRPADYITKVTPVRLVAEATCPRWEAFLRRVVPSGAVRDFLQRAVGYSLTGDVGAQVFFFLYGGGSNGKSVLSNTVLTMLGDYATGGAPDLLVEQRNEQHPTDQAALFGRRMVVCSETEQGRWLAEAKVKRLTGGDPITARFMRQDFFTFKPTFKLWVLGNHQLRIRNTGHAIWRRILQVPFTETIPDEEKDEKLEAKLRGELDGIFGWAVRGCLAYQKHGLQPPAEVIEATNAYRESQDHLGAFLAEACLVSPVGRAIAKDVYAAYVGWCSENGELSLTKRGLGKELHARGFEDTHSNLGQVWRGLSLLKAAGSPGPRPRPSSSPWERGQDAQPWTGGDHDHE